MISVVIRNKNQAKALNFLLKDLTERYSNDIDEILVIDNLSKDNSEEVAIEYGARFVTIKDFSIGGSANLCAKEAKSPIVVIFSAHSYPVSHDFFKLIRKKFEDNPKLAGLRCLHAPNDYKNFINNIPATIDPNKSGLIFSGSAFNKRVWRKHPFKEDVATFEDKEWTVRVLKEGYDIDFVASIFCSYVKRTRKQLFYRFKNDMVGNYQLWHQDIGYFKVTKSFLVSVFNVFGNLFLDLYFIIKRFFYSIGFIFNKPDKF